MTNLIPRPTSDLTHAASDTAERALRGVLSEHSRRAYRADFADLARYLHPASSTLTATDLQTLDADTIADYRDHLRRERNLSTGTVNRRLAAIRKLLQAAVDRGMRRDNPAKVVKGYKGSYKETPALTEDEARKLLAQTNREALLGLRDYALLQVGIRLGLRREEISRLRSTSFRTQRGRRIVHIEGKGDKTRIVPVPGDVYDHIVAWVEQSGRSMEQDIPIFTELKARGRGKDKRYVSPTPEEPLTTNGVWAVVLKYAAAAGLEGITPHSLRATFVTLALQHGAPLQKVQYAAGHSDPRTTERYDRSRQAIDNPATDYVPVL